MGDPVKKVQATTNRYLFHVTRSKNRVKEAFEELEGSSFMAVQASV